MWPWEHLAFGYLLWAGSVHLRGRRRVRADEALAVVLATQLPDLIDKPLAWTFAVLPSGVSLAHSLSFALPVTAAAVLLGRRTGRRTAAAAFAVAYGSHLLGDALYPLVRGHSFSPWFALWPFVSVPSNHAHPHGLLRNVAYYLDGYIAMLLSPRGFAYVVLELALLGAALAVWLYDDTPGLPDGRRSDPAERPE